MPSSGWLGPIEQRIFKIVFNNRGHHRKGIIISNAIEVNLQLYIFFKNYIIL